MIKKELDAISRAKSKAGNDSYKQLHSHQDAMSPNASTAEWSTNPGNGQCMESHAEYVAI